MITPESMITKVSPLSIFRGQGPKMPPTRYQSNSESKFVAKSPQIPNSLAITSSINTNRFFSLPTLVPRVTGAQLIFELLQSNGVTSVSGYSGGAVLPLIDVFANPPQGRDSIPFYLHANEAAAGHSAEAMAKVSGHLGCCIVTSGPGITNCITPMQDSKADGVPMLFISGQVPTNSVGKEAFQEVAAVEVSRPVTKWTFCITDVRDIGWVISRGCSIAKSGRPGPVHIDIPKDVLVAAVPVEFDPNHSANQKRNFTDTDDFSGLEGSLYPECLPVSLSSAHNYDDDVKLQKLLLLLSRCKKPIVHIGAGAIQCPESIQSIVKLLNCPVSSTLHGMGVVSEREPLSLGMIGMHGSVYGNIALQEADLIVGFGARFDDRTTGTPASFARNAYLAAESDTGGVVHIDIDPSMFGKSGIVPTLSILGDLKVMGPKLEQLIKESDAIKQQQDEWKSWISRITALKEQYPHYIYSQGMENSFNGKAVIHHLDAYLELHGLGDDKIICTGVGNHQMYCCQLMTWSKERQFISSGGLGTMGVGLPFAIGSKIACGQEKRVFLIDGDGSFNMSSSDLQTVSRYNVPMAIFILNDGKQSMVSSWQDFFFEGRQYITTNHNPDYKKLAESHGIEGITISSVVELKTHLPYIVKRSAEAPLLIDCRIESDYAFPICPPGTALENTFYTLEDFEKNGTVGGSAPS